MRLGARPLRDQKASDDTGAFLLAQRGIMMSVTADDLTDLSDSFETAYPQDILRWAAENFGDQLAVVTSFQPTGIVTLHMLSEIAPNTPVLTLDTGLLFPETYALMDELENRL
jgi:phosphoadenosine phosphosulfate reductase